MTRRICLGTRDRDEQGFTLIELLVVIIIIGVLAAIAIPIFMNQQKAAADATTKQDIKTVAIATATFMAEKGVQADALPTYGEQNYIYTTNKSDLGGWGGAPGDERGDSALVNLIEVSDGTKLGIYASGAGSGFCIVAGNVGGNYDFDGASSGPSSRSMLYYSSTEGSVQTFEELNHTGACQYYFERG